MTSEQLAETVITSVLRKAVGAATAWWSKAMPTVLLLSVVFAGLWAAWQGVKRIPEHYKAIGRLECSQAVSSATATAVASQASGVISQAASQVAHAQATGTKAERKRSRINAHFNRLNEEARHDTPDPVDACVLPPDRLRRWAAANAGDGASTSRSAASAAATQPHHGTPTASGPGIGPDEGSGSQSPGRGPRVSPAGQPALPPTEVHGGHP
jgi:hypothetical protein